MIPCTNCGGLGLDWVGSLVSPSSTQKENITTISKDNSLKVKFNKSFLLSLK